MEEYQLKTDDNHIIAVNMYSTGNRDSVLIIAPGWYMTKDARAFKDISEECFKFIDVITMDFRGHGKSSGFFTFTAKEVKDMSSVVKFAKERYSKVYLMGFSLGAATSVLYTSKYKDVDGVIAVSPPADFDKIEHKSYRKEAWMPTLKKFEIKRHFSIRPGNLFRKKVKPISVVDKISPIPILFIAGKNDPTVFPWHTESLYEKSGEPKYIKIFEDGKHAEDIFLEHKEGFMSLIKENMFKNLE